MPVTAEMRDLLERMAPKGNVSLHLPASVDETLGSVYQNLITFKMEMDAMEEIPNSLMPLYKETMKAMDGIRKAREHTYQLRMLTQRYAQKHR